MQLKKQSAEPVPGCLLALDSLLHDTLDSSFDYRDGSVYQAVLDCALRSRGWRSLTGGRTYATKIENALLNLYGSYVSATDISAKQLHATLCNKSVAPRYVLQLAVLLRLTLYDLLHAPDAVLDYKGRDERNVSIRSQHVPYSAAVRHGRKDCGKMGETVRAMILSAIVYNGSCISMLPLFPYLPPFFYYFYVLFSSHRIPFESR